MPCCGSERAANSVVFLAFGSQAVHNWLNNSQPHRRAGATNDKSPNDKSNARAENYTSQNEVPNYLSARHAACFSEGELLRTEIDRVCIQNLRPLLPHLRCLTDKLENLTRGLPDSNETATFGDATRHSASPLVSRAKTFPNSSTLSEIVHNSTQSTLWMQSKT